MPYVDVVGDTVRCSTYFGYDNGQVEVCTINYMCTVAGGVDTRQPLAASVNNAWQIKYQPMLSATTVIFGTKVWLYPPALPYTPVIAQSNFPGTATVGDLPTQNRPIGTLHTEWSGPKWRGRMYMPTPAVDKVNAKGQPGVTLNQAIVDTLTMLLTTFTSNGSTWVAVLVHRKKPGETQIANSRLQYATAAGKFGRQKRSGDYGKENVAPW